MYPEYEPMRSRAVALVATTICGEKIEFIQQHSAAAYVGPEQQ